MIVAAWNNGKHHQSGAGYGFKLVIKDRDQYFQPEWEKIVLELEGYPKLIEVNVKKESFWGPDCRELINEDIGIWLRRNELAPWQKHRPPKFVMWPVGEKLFKVSKKPIQT